MIVPSRWPPGQIYSPVPTAADVARATTWHQTNAPANLPGIRLNLDGMWRHAETLGRVTGTFALQATPTAERLYGFQVRLLHEVGGVSLAPQVLRKLLVGDQQQVLPAVGQKLTQRIA